MEIKSYWINMKIMDYKKIMDYNVKGVLDIGREK